MNKEKQIEEMAKVIKSSLEGLGSGNFHFTGDEISKMFAEHLYNAGYRKQSEGEWIAYPDEHEICATEFVCSNCKESFCTNEMTDWEFIETMKYCPNCGAKMKGGAE